MRVPRPPRRRPRPRPRPQDTPLFRPRPRRMPAFPSEGVPVRLAAGWRLAGGYGKAVERMQLETPEFPWDFFVTNLRKGKGKL